MILVADAGATKISWALLDREKFKEFNTSGYNPNVADSNYLRQILISGFPVEYNPSEVKNVWYFGTGCGSAFGKERVEKALHVFFVASAEIRVMTDLEGAGLAIFNKSEGIVGILGTGANAGFYNGKTIVNTPVSLGYLLGDEGSGAYLGKMLVPKIIRRELPTEIIDTFYSSYSLTSAELIKNIYSSPQPNRYLASFVPFIKANMHITEIEQLIYDGFELYCKYYMKPVLAISKKHSVGMIGGVAHAFQPQLNKVFIEQGIGECNIIDSPLKSLIEQFKR